jgi:hypothetical protein
MFYKPMSWLQYFLVKLPITLSLARSPASTCPTYNHVLLGLKGGLFFIRILHQRQRQEKEEGKTYNEPGARFSLFNLFQCMLTCGIGVSQNEGFEQQVWPDTWCQFLAEPFCLGCVGIPWIVDWKLCWCLDMSVVLAAPCLIPTFSKCCDNVKHYI